MMSRKCCVFVHGGASDGYRLPIRTHCMCLYMLACTYECVCVCVGTLDDIAADGLSLIVSPP